MSLTKVRLDRKAKSCDSEDNTSGPKNGERKGSFSPVSAFVSASSVSAPVSASGPKHGERMVSSTKVHLECKAKSCNSEDTTSRPQLGVLAFVSLGLILGFPLATSLVSVAGLRFRLSPRAKDVS